MCISRSRRRSRGRGRGRSRSRCRCRSSSRRRSRSVSRILRISIMMPEVIAKCSGVWIKCTTFARSLPRGMPQSGSMITGPLGQTC